MTEKEDKKKKLLETMNKAKFEISKLQSGETLLSPVEKSTIKQEEDKMRNNKEEDNQGLPFKQLTMEEVNALSPEELEERARIAIELKIKAEMKKAGIEEDYIDDNTLIQSSVNNKDTFYIEENDSDEVKKKKEYIKKLGIKNIKKINNDDIFDYSYEKKEVFNPLKYPNEPLRMLGPDLEDFMKWAVSQGTSDVFIQTDELITCDIHGKKHKVSKYKISNPQVMNMISYIYKSEAALSQLNGGQEVDTQWSIKLDKSHSLRFRINITSHQSYGVKGYEITIRTINGRAPLLETLDLPPPLVKRLSPKQGLIMVSGATGSGKSTLLASIIDWRLRDPQAHIKILTYEKPIEFIYDEVEKQTSLISQVEIGVHLPSFEKGISNSLRRKPDIILVGEMRDKETIGEGITASMTGHLVFGTVHATTVANTILRMVNSFGVEEKDARKSDIIGSIHMIIAQRLLNSADGKRVAVREFLFFNQEMKNFLSNVDTKDLIYEVQKLVEEHGQTFIDDITQKYIEGKITQKVYDEELNNLGYI